MSDLNDKLRAQIEALPRYYASSQIGEGLVEDPAGDVIDRDAVLALLSATPAPQAAPSDTIAKAKRVMLAIDEYLDFQTSERRAAIRAALLDELAAAPAAAITPAATSEPVAVPQVELDSSMNTWMDVKLEDVPVWKRKGFNIRTLYAAPAAAHPAPSDERECWNCGDVGDPCYDGGTPWCVKCGVVDKPSEPDQSIEDAQLDLDAYERLCQSKDARIKELEADLRAALSASSAVQSEDAKELTDEQIVEVLSSLGIDSEKSKYGFDVLQVRTTVPAIRDIVKAYRAVLASQGAKEGQ